MFSTCVLKDEILLHFKHYFQMMFELCFYHFIAFYKTDVNKNKCCSSLYVYVANWVHVCLLVFQVTSGFAVHEFCFLTIPILKQCGIIRKLQKKNSIVGIIRRIQRRNRTQKKNKAFVAADADTTVTMPPTTMDPDMMTTQMAAQILYDMRHHKAMIVRADGCYEYHMNHQDVVDHATDATRMVMEARMLSELASAVNIQETGHNHINHMTQDIVTACASLPVYSFDIV